MKQGALGGSNLGWCGHTNVVEPHRHGKSVVVGPSLWRRSISSERGLWSISSYHIPSSIGLHRMRTHTAEPSDSSYWWENLAGRVVKVSRESLQVNRCRRFWGGQREVGGTISQHRLGVWGVRLSKCLSDGIIFSGKQETRSLLRVQEDAECADNLFMCSVIEKSLIWVFVMASSVGAICLQA